MGIGLDSGTFNELVFAVLRLSWLDGVFSSSGAYSKLASKNNCLVVEDSIWLERLGNEQIASMVHNKKMTSSSPLVHTS